MKLQWMCEEIRLRWEEFLLRAIIKSIEKSRKKDYGPGFIYPSRMLTVDALLIRLMHMIGGTSEG